MAMKGAGLMSGLNEGMTNFLDAYVKMKQLKNSDEDKERQRMLQDVDMKYKQHQMDQSLEDKNFGRAKDLNAVYTAQADRLGSYEAPQDQAGLLTKYGLPTSYKGKKDGDSLARQLQFLNIQEKIAERDKKASPQGRLEALSAEGKSKVGALASGLTTADELESLYNEGGKKSYIDTNTPFIGSLLSDTPVDVATRKLKDDIGRMRSGGAIGADETKNFLSMLPTAADTPDIKKLKLQKLKDELRIRSKAQGFDEEELSQLGLLKKKEVDPEYQRYLELKAKSEKSGDKKNATISKGKSRT